MKAEREPSGTAKGADVSRASNRPLPRRAAVVLAMVMLVLLAGASANGSSSFPASVDSSTHLDTQVTATLGAVALGPRSLQQVPAPGQPVIPAALPAVALFALLVGLLLATAAGPHPPLQVTQRRLPLRRGPPRDHVSR